MRKIILTTSLFFCLAITTILAQVATINIATPNSNGLSNNQVNSFDVNSDGTILNNSATGGTAQLGNTGVAANNNITGSEASLILFQVTGTGGSDLNGAIEVFGGEAGLIIANPNGIDCDGCGFINISKVDLVTGTANFSGDDLTGFSIDGSSTLTVSGSGFLSDAVADELNLTSGRYTQSGTINITGDLNIQISGEASLDDNASIKARNLFFSAYDLSNQADITITENATFDIENDFKNGFDLDGTAYAGGNIIADNFNVTAGNNFVSRYSSTISADNFNVTAGNNFFSRNSVTINANDFNVTVGGDFQNRDSGTINAGSFNVTTRTYFSNNSRSMINANSFIVTTGSYFSNENNSTINTNIFNVTTEYDFANKNSSTINANDFSVTVLRGEFVNKDSATIDADTVTIDVTNFVDDIFNTATISSDSLNIILTDDFTHSSTSFSGFTFNNLGVSTDGSFTNNANLTVNNFNVTAEDDFINRATINADNFNVTARDDFFNRDGATINVDNFNVTAGDDFFNRDGATINADNFNVTAGDDFSNWYTATINANDFNVIAGTDFINESVATINADNFNVIAGDDFYNYSYGTISADNFNVIAGKNFYYYGVDFELAANNSLIVLGDAFVDVTNFNNHGTVATDSLSITVENFASNIYNTGTISSDSLNLIITDSFTHQSISFNGFTFNNLGINTGGDFTNRHALNVSGALTITVADFDANISNDSTISSDSLNLITSSNFTLLSNTFDDFTFNSLAITANNYTQGVPIDIAGDLSIQASGEASLDDNASIKARNLFFSAYDLSNQADITITDNATFDIENNFFNGFNLDGTDYNGGDIIANDFNVTAGNDFLNRYNATITANNSFNVVVGGGTFRNRDSATITADSFNVTTGTYFYNYRSTITANNFNVTAGSYFENTNSTITANDFNVTAEGDFVNKNSATINADTVTIDVTNFVGDIFNSATISSASLNFILTDSFTRSSTSFNNFTFNNLGIDTDGLFHNEADLTVNNFNVTVGNDFSNQSSSTINANNFNVTAEDDFFNNGNSTINADNFNVTAGNQFFNKSSSTINADNFSVTVLRGDFANNDAGSTINANNFNVTAGIDFFNDRSATINADNFNVTAGETAGHRFVNRSSSIINANSFNVIAAGDFLNQSSSTINADNVTIEVTNFDNDIDNSATVSADSLNFILTDGFTRKVNSFDDFNNFSNLTITTDGSFTNEADLTVNNFNVTAGDDFNNSATINADTVTIEVTNFANDISNTATISSASLNLILTDDFTRSSTSFSGFIFNNLGIITDGSFTNEADLTVNNLNVTAGNNFNNQNATIDAENFNVTAGDFDNYATISADSFNVTAVDTFNNRSYATINAASFDATANYFFNEANAEITANECNIIHTTFYRDLGTITCDYDEAEIEVIDIARPDVNGLSNNIYTNFNIFNRGIVLNNSDSAGTSQLAGDISANTNYNSGDAASLILAQITGNDISLLEGALEVFGAEAGVIIANPNGITCNGCSFINASRVDLVTGSNYNVATDTFDSIANTNIALIDSGLDASSVGILNIQAGSFTNAGGLNANIFNLSVAGDFDYTNNGTITANTYNLQVDGDFSYNDAANDFVWGDSDTLTVSGSASIVAAGFANSGTITTNNALNLTANTFVNTGGVLNADTFNLNTANTFVNTGGVLDADTFALSVAGDFDYVADFLGNGTITTNADNLHIGADFSYDDSANDFVLGINDTLTVLGSANIVAADFANSGTIAVTGSLGITAAGFDNSSIIRASSNFNATVATFINRAGATITAAECNFVHDSVTDEGTITCLNSNTIEATVDNIAEPNGSGLSVNNYEAFHIPVNGRVFNNSVSGATSQLLGDVPANPNFISGNAANIILAQVTGTDISLLLGTFEVVGSEAEVIIANPNGISCNGCSVINASQLDLRTDNSIAIADNGLDASAVGILNIRADSFTSTGVLEANILNLNVDGDFDYTQRGIINTTSLNLEVGGDFSNNDESIGFVWEENDTLTVSGDANITALNFINHGTINITNSFGIATGYTAINQGSIVSDILAINADDFFRNLTDGDIDVASLNITAGGKVTNTANINVTGTLTITANDDSTRTDDRTGFYVSNRGNITATTLNITAVDNFYNRGNITATNFTTSAKDIFLLNEEINSFYAAGNTYDGGYISLARDSSLIAAGIIENYGNIDLGSNNLDITANSFTNHASANVTANTVNLAVSSSINDGSIDAVVINNGGIIYTTNDTTNDQ